MHDSASSGYQRQASTYADIRPSYHPQLVRRFVERWAGDAVVEIGAGTGIFTRQLIELGCQPIAVEPVDAMRAELIARSPDIDARSATASATGIEANRASCVVASQSFHWFDHGPALDEIDRILRPGGHLVTVWNVRDESVPWVAAYTEIVDRHAGATPRYRTMRWRQAIERDGRFVLVDEWSIDHPRATTAQGVVERARSTSFIAALDDAEEAEVARDLLAAVADLGETFDYPYRSELQAWQRVEA